MLKVSNLENASSTGLQLRNAVHRQKCAKIAFPRRYLSKLTRFQLRRARRTGEKTLITVIGISLVLCMSCYKQTVTLAGGSRDFQPYDYRKVYDLWTREFQVLPVDGIENVLTARATYLSHEFRWAYVVREGYDLRLTPEQRQKLHRREFTDEKKRHEFFVTIMSGVQKSDDLDPSTGPWLVRLEDDQGRQVEPVEVHEVRKPTINELTYFFFDRVHRKAYRIYFPRIADDGTAILSQNTRYFSLEFSSALGQGTMRWETEKREQRDSAHPKKGF